MTRLLLVTPVFHGYGHSIAESFERIGYEVAIHEYDRVGSRATKAWNKVRHELPSRVRGDDLHQSLDAMSLRAIEAVRTHRPDIVLVIRGDVFDEEFWGVAGGEGRRAALWLYDEVRRTPRFDREVVARHAALATYSPLDALALTAAGYPTTYVPTGFDDRRPVGMSSQSMHLVNFIGAPLPRRLDALGALLDADVPVRAWGRGWSDHPVDRARTWRARGRGIPNARDVPGDVALAIMRDSAATLNVHGDQDGLTMRTFESCGVGGVQLIDRPDIGSFYEPEREVLVFDSLEELVEQARRALDRPQDFAQLRERARNRTLAEHTFVHRARQLEQLWS
ncbi:CgeB family protein [Calidifontibacter terrae]